MFSTRVLLLLVLISCAYGHKKVKTSKSRLSELVYSTLYESGVNQDQTGFGSVPIFQRYFKATWISHSLCDQDKKHNSHNVGIIGGHKISIEQVPFIVSVRLNGTFHWCGGSIIHERFILSAAHCIVPDREFKVLVGTDKVDEGGKLYDVEKIIIHENYSNKTNDYDVCILKLNESLTFGPTVAKVLLTGNIVKLKKGTQLNTTGWGYTHPEGRISNHLLQTTVPVVPWLHCQLSYGKQRRITHRMLCAGGHGKDSCMGDSGGPLTWNNVQVGITSFGAGCGIVPGVYTKISAVKQWIEDTVKNHHKKEEKRVKSQITKKIFKRALQ